MTSRPIPAFAAAILSACLSPLAGAALQETKVPRPPPNMPVVKGPSTALRPPTAATADAGVGGVGDATGAAPAAERAAVLKGEPRAGVIVPDRSRVLYDDGDASRLWARGATYKASFGSDGFTYIPFLGSAAEQNHPVRFSVARASVGGVELTVAEDAIAVRTDDRITLARGGLVEVYDLEPERIEQTFVIADLPLRGELALRLDVETDLTALDVGPGLEFGCERGSVRYGDVTVLDARGARVDVASRLSGGQIAIDVPAAFVAAAVLPLRVDPMVSTFYLNDSTLVHFLPDIAYDAGLARWYAVYEEVFSSTDHDVYSVLLDVNGVTIPASGAYVDSTTSYWTNPRVANNGLNSTFYCTAAVIPAAGGNTDIRGRSRSAASTSQTAQTILSGPHVGAKHSPDVGGDPVLSGPTYFFVVWQRNFNSTDSDVHGQLIAFNGALMGSTVLIENSSATRDEYPRISKTDGNAPYATQEWNIVWDRYNGPVNTFDVMAAQVHWDGGITTPAFYVDFSTNSDTFPAASSLLDGGTGARPWMIVYTRGLGAQNDILGRVLVGSTPKAFANLSQMDGTAQGENQIAPSIDTDGSQFTVMWMEPYQGSALDYDIYASTYWYAGEALGASETRAQVDASAVSAFLPRLAFQRGSSSATSRFGVVWDWRLTSGDFDVLAGFYTVPAGGTAYPFCFGDGTGAGCPCGNDGTAGNGCANSIQPGGANLAGSGSHRVAADTFVLSASNMPPTTSCLFFQGDAKLPGPAFGDGLRCAGGQIRRLATKTTAGGSASFPGAGDAPLSQQGLLTPVGGMRTYQVWYRNAALFCTASTFNLTNGFAVVWLP